MSDDIPNWENMPKDHPILTLSWEDVYGIAKEESQSKFNRDPTQDEVTTIFETIKRKGMDCESSTFWSTLDYYVSEFYSALEK